LGTITDASSEIEVNEERNKEKEAAGLDIECGDRLKQKIMV